MKYSSRGFVSTTIFHIIILLILIFFGFSYPDPPPEELGILVNFGTDLTGFGNIEPAGNKESGVVKESIPAEAIPESSVKEKAEVEKVKEKPVEKNVQSFEESPVKIKTPTPEELRQKEIERQKQEALLKQKAEEERQRKLAEQWSNKGQAAFGNKSVGTTQGSEGITAGAGNQGNPNGTQGADNYGPGGGLGNGISFGLDNRTGQIPKPIDKCVVTSKVIIKVQIVVDREGNVVGSPKVIESNFQDPCIYEAVILAASKAKFNKDPQASYRQQGWIRYIYEP